MIKFSCAAFSNVGKYRENNEDNFYVNGRYREFNELKIDSYIDRDEHPQYLYAVCDGMGGEKFGELASMIAVEHLSEIQTTDVTLTIQDYIRSTNEQICNEINKNNGTRIGTTLALLYINQKKAIVYNIGDSRVYLYRKGKLTQLSKDHTQAQQLVEMGVIEQNQAMKHKAKHQLTQHLGIFPEELIIEPFISKEISVKRNDLFLLCSDGLTDMVGEDELRMILSDHKKDVEVIANELVVSALNHGGKDNVTSIVVKADESRAFLAKHFF